MAGRCSQMKQNLEQLTISIDLPGKSFQESWNILSLIPLTVDVSPLHANLNCSTAHSFSAPPFANLRHVQFDCFSHISNDDNLSRVSSERRNSRTEDPVRRYTKHIAFSSSSCSLSRVI